MKIYQFLTILLISLAVVFVSAQEAATVEAKSADPDSTEEAVEEPATDTTTTEETAASETKTKDAPVQSGPYIDLLGETLLSLEMIDEASASLKTHYTNAALDGKKVVGLYFSADWCGPCRQFTPELLQFYSKINSKRKNSFEIVWISRCRDVNSFGQYFTQMNWLALPPEEAMGQRGQILSAKYKVKGIPTLVLLDETGSVITTDARNKIPQDKAGIGFPWRNPFATFYMTIVPKSLRLMVRSQVTGVKDKLLGKVKTVLGGGRKSAATATA